MMREAAASWVLNLESFIGAASNSGMHPTRDTPPLINL
jgi:hypothetical protein